MSIDRSSGLAYGISIPIHEDNKQAFHNVAQHIVGYDSNNFYDMYDVKEILQDKFNNFIVDTVGTDEEEHLVIHSEELAQNICVSWNYDIRPIISIDFSQADARVEASFDDIVSLLRENNVDFEGPRWFIHSSVF